MRNCPNCKHKLYGKDGQKRHCNFCGYTNEIGEEIGIPKVQSSVNLPENKNNSTKIIELARKSIDEFETFYLDIEEDANLYVVKQQYNEMIKLLKRFTTRMNQIINFAEVEEEPSKKKE